MNQYMEWMVGEYGRGVGISIDYFGNDQLRYRRKLTYDTPGVWISEDNAQKILETAEQVSNDRVLRQLEDAFGPGQSLSLL